MLLYFIPVVPNRWSAAPDGAARPFPWGRRGSRRLLSNLEYLVKKCAVKKDYDVKYRWYESERGQRKIYTCKEREGGERRKEGGHIHAIHHVLY